MARKRTGPKRISSKPGAGRAKRGGRGGAARLAARAVSPATLRRRFPDLKTADGCSASLIIAERSGSQWDHAHEIAVVSERKSDKASAVGGLRAPKLPARTCQALAALGHEQRGKILAKLLEGPATYRALQRTTKLQAGPLYHHVNQLRLAGLVLPKQRDLYELTRSGRNLLLTALALGPLLRDKRRRPLPKPM